MQNLKLLTFFCLLFSASLCAYSSEPISLTRGIDGKAVMWQFQIDPLDVGEKEGWYDVCNTLSDSIVLPGSMAERLKGYEVTANTQWVGGLYDSSYYRNPYMEKYRREGNVKVPFFLTPVRHYVGKAWYRTTVNIPKGKLKKQGYQLFLERPHIISKVWVNGQCLPPMLNAQSSKLNALSQNSLSVPHCYDVMNLHEGENVITICIDNDYEKVNVGKDSHSVSDQTQGCWNGMVGEIELRERTYIKDMRVYPDVDNKRVRVDVTFNALSEGKEGFVLTLVAESFNTAKRHIVASDPTRINLAGKETTRTFIINMGDGMLLWDEHCPQMYRLEAQVSQVSGSKTSGSKGSRFQEVQGSKVVQYAETYFGMRKIEMRDKMFFLNGKEIQLRGTVENCCFPLTGYPPMDLQSWMKLFETCKAWGLNHMRFHTYCPPEAAFLAADLVGFFLQPEGPSWPNHGVKLGRGEYIDTYLYDEGVRIYDTYGNHPSFCFYAFGNEPAGNWVRWSTEHVARLQQYDMREGYPERHLNCGFSVGGGWAWQPGSQYAVKAGARGLDEWNNKAPESMKVFSERINTYNGKDMPGTPITMPFVSHETGQWCAFPDFSEIEKYKGVTRAGNFEIFRDILAENGMADRARSFLMASGKLQTLCYKYEIERTLRTPRYAGFQLLSLNDYSGQGTALVGLTNVFFEEKGYVTPKEFREFCSDIVPLASFPKFVYSNDETFECQLQLNQYSGDTLNNAVVNWELKEEQEVQGVHASNLMLKSSSFKLSDPITAGLTDVGTISVPLSDITKATKLTLTVSVPGTEARNHWEIWVYPKVQDVDFGDVYVTDTLDAKALKKLKKGGKVLVCAAGKVSYGREVKQYFTPVFWNTSWFKMRPPHTTGIYVEENHPAFRLFPTEYHSNMQWWELVNKAQVMQLTDFPADFQPLVQSIDTWFVSRKIGMLIEANVSLGKKAGRLMMTSMDLLNNDSRPVARQMLLSLLAYMNSADFQPKHTIALQNISDLFTKIAGEVNMYTNDSPDELKPKLK